MKQQTVYTTPIDADLPTVTVRITGLRQLNGDMFEFQGITPRFPKWDDVADAIGGADEDLIDVLAAALFKHDITQALVNRIKP